MHKQLIMLILLTIVAGCDFTNNITGKVLLKDETPLSGVQLTLTKGAFQTNTETNEQGNYLFAEMDNGTYIITPSRDGYLFEPAYQSITIRYEDIIDVNFIAMIPDIEIEDFCGWSTRGQCYSDFDCITGGCSGQVCESAYDNESIFTTCEWQDCYDDQQYGLSCLCVAGECVWTKQ